MKTFIAIVLACFATTALGDELHVLSLDEFSFEHYKILNDSDPYYPFQDPGSPHGEYWDHGDAALFNIDIVKYGPYRLGIDNRVHGEATNDQYRQVGWQIDAHAGYDNYCEFFYRHHSQHMLDKGSTYHFPLENTYGVKATFYKRDR